jgi:hypothetical protein
MGEKGVIEDVSFWLIKIILLFIFLYLVYKLVVSYANPDMQNALLSTERLRAKINEACLNGDQVVVMDNFRLTQPKPSKMWGLTDVLPRFAISSGGDPNFVLYYEAFPVGEAIGWEVYQDFGTRVITPFKAVVDPVTSDEFKDIVLNVHLKSIEDDLKIRFSDYERNMLVNNILLDNDVRAVPAGYISSDVGPLDYDGFGSVDETDEEPNPVISKKNPLGTWVKDAPTEKDDRYVFKNYRSLTQLEQSFIKYRPCGDNSLCLKTRDSVYRFPLDESCSDVEYIQFVYDNREPNVLKIAPGVITVSLLAVTKVSILKYAGRWGFVGALTSILYSFHEIIAFPLRYKVSDFYAASPCSFETLEIEKLDSCNIPADDFVESHKMYLCKNMIKYPIYDYGETIRIMGDHYTCVDSLGDDFGVKKNEEYHTENHEGPCIRITATGEIGDFCFTRDPEITQFTDPNSVLPEWLQNIRNFFHINEKLTVVMSELFGGTPVRDTTIFFNVPNPPTTENVVLKPASIAESILGENREAYQKAWSWGWP